MQLNEMYKRLITERDEKLKELEGLIAEYVRYATAIELCKEMDNEKLD